MIGSVAVVRGGTHDDRILCKGLRAITMASATCELGYMISLDTDLAAEEGVYRSPDFRGSNGDALNHPV